MPRAPQRRILPLYRRPFFDRLRVRLRRLLRRRLRPPVWYTPAYRIPIPSLEALSGSEPRRADLAVWYLLEERLTRERDLRTPQRASYESIARVHDASYLESLSHADALARIFAVSPGEIVVDEVMHTVRLAVGGTIAAAQAARATSGPAFNLLGGFHHAGPALGGGMCVLNDVAIAIADLRANGFEGQVVVLDLDAHPADGLSSCLVDDPRVQIGSLTGSDWGALPGSAIETFVPDADDASYLAALATLLARMPDPDMTFVLAGGDVLAGDRLGKLKLTLEGTRARDVMVAEWIDHGPSVWLPAGGYSQDGWKVLVGAYLAVTRRSRRPVKDRDPMMTRFAAIGRGLNAERLSGNVDDWSDVESDLFGSIGPAAPPRLLDFYTAEGLEYALTRYGVAEHLRRLGYHDLVIHIDAPDEVGQRTTVHGTADGVTHLLVDLIVSRDTVASEPALVVHWMSLRNPRAIFTEGRRALPGQEVPGLGLAKDMGQLFGRMVERLGLALVALRPAYLHTAYAGRNRFHFLDEERQLRFVRLLRDLRATSLSDISRALAEGRVRLDGAPYAWEADLMIYRPNDPPPSLDPPDETRRFSIVAAS